MQVSKSKNLYYRCFQLLLLIAILCIQPVSARLRSQVNRTDLNLGQSLNLMIIVDDFKLKNLSFPFDTADYQVVANSSSTSFQIINGVTSQNKTYTFTIIPKHAGSITLPPATMTDGLETAQTEPITITVRGGAGTSSTATASSTNTASTGTAPGPSQQASPSSAASALAALSASMQRSAPVSPSRSYQESLIARLETNNSNPYKNQQVNIKLKIYHRGNLRTLNIAPLNVENFIIRKDDTAKEYQESYNGLDYLVYELNFIGFPIKSGSLTIPGHEIQATLVEDAIQPSSFFDPFGIMNPFLVDKEKTIKTNSLSFKIKDLPPGAPKDFSGYVGELAVNNEISNLVTMPGEAITLKTKIYGTGNTKNLKFDLVKNSRLYTAFKDKHKIDEQIESSKQYFETLISTAIVPSYNSGKIIVEIKPLISFNPSTGKYEEHGQESFEISINTNGASLTQDPSLNTASMLTKNQSGINSNEIINISKKQILGYKPAIYENSFVLFLVLAFINFISLVFYLSSRIKQNSLAALDKFYQARKSIKQAGSVAELSMFLRSFSQDLEVSQLDSVKLDIENFFAETDRINYGSVTGPLNQASQAEQLDYFKSKALAIIKALKEGSKKS